MKESRRSSDRAKAARTDNREDRRRDLANTIAEVEQPHSESSQHDCEVQPRKERPFASEDSGGQQGSCRRSGAGVLGEEHPANDVKSAVLIMLPNRVAPDALRLHPDWQSDALAAGALEQGLGRHGDTTWSSEAGRRSFESSSFAKIAPNGRGRWTDASTEARLLLARPQDRGSRGTVDEKISGGQGQTGGQLVSKNSNRVRRSHVGEAGPALSMRCMPIASGGQLRNRPPLADILEPRSLEQDATPSPRRSPFKSPSPIDGISELSVRWRSDKRP